MGPPERELVSVEPVQPERIATPNPPATTCKKPRRSSGQEVVFAGAGVLLSGEDAEESFMDET